LTQDLLFCNLNQMDDCKGIIFLDIDGVLVNPTVLFLQELNKIEGTNYVLDDLTEFEYIKCLPKRHAEMMLDMWKNPNLYDNTEPDPKGVSAIQKLRKFARVIALSAPTVGHTDSKFRFLTRQPLFFEKKDIVVARDKSFVRGDLIIDDWIENLLSFSGNRICYPQPWNTDWDINLGPRTSDWNEIVKIAREILKK
jgi:5'(3')-deoxyribonucleotidase